MTRTKPILRWPGGKSRLLKKILPLMPAHECYCEPFAGGLAVLFAKERSPLEIINDVNGDLVALYLSVQNHLPEMLRLVDQVVSSRALFFKMIGSPGLTEIQRAMSFVVRNRTSFGGKMSSFAVDRLRGSASFSRGSFKELVTKAHERLDKVVIENISYERCLVNYDSRQAFFFLDPPYVDSPTGAYDGFTEADAKLLRKRVGALQGKWMVTLNDSPFVRSLFAGCNFVANESQNGCVNQARTPRTFAEVIITP